MDSEHEKINYVELSSADIGATQRFHSKVFGWQLEGFGPEYTAFSGTGLDGDFYLASMQSRSRDGAALIVLYNKDLTETQNKITAAGSLVVKSCFDFPGGRRFHFEDATGNELAVWSER